MNGPKRFALVIGAMKAGTTSLFNRLAQHPQLAPCKVKEPNYFTFDDLARGGLPGYQALWPGFTEDHAYALESSTTYTKQPRHLRVPERIRFLRDEAGCEFKLIYCLRDPLDRIRSHVSWGLVTSEEGLHQAAIRDGSMEGRALEISMYARQLDAYAPHFDLDEDLHLFAFEDLVEHPETTLDGIAKFLGLDPFSFPEPERVDNPTTGRYEKGKLWNALERTDLIRLAELVPERFKGVMRERLGDRREEKVALSEELEGFYRSALAEDVDRLQDVYGFDTGRWSVP